MNTVRTHRQVFPVLMALTLMPSIRPASAGEPAELSARSVQGVHYVVADETDSEGDRQQTAYAVTGSARQRMVSNERVTIEAVEDIDGDGIVDALISSGHDGNCCQPDYGVHSLIDGAVTSAPLAFGDQHAIEGEPGHRHLRSTSTSDGTKLLRFDRGQLIETLTIPPLAALVEVVGTAPWPDPPQPPRILNADLDDDGRDERIACEVNLHFGSVDCALPRADGSLQSMGECQRFGMLALRLNGRHAFVCDNDTLVIFDGYQWRMR